VYHAQPYGVDARKERENGFDKVIINTVWETTSIPESWFPAINYADAVFVPSQQNIQALKDSGVTPPIYLVPHGAEVDMFNPNNKPFVVDKSLDNTFNFLSIFQWQHRKGPDVLLKAYWNEFTKDDNVSLVVKSYWNPNVKGSQRVVRDKIAQYKHYLGYGDDRAPVFYTGSDFDEEDLRGLYTMSDIFVLPTRGEGVGLPYMEAMASGIPCIATGWGGQTDFINSDNGFILDYKLESTHYKIEEALADNYFPGFTPEMNWAEPSVEHLQKLMRYAYENQDDVTEKGLLARESMKSQQWSMIGFVLKNFIEKVVL
jgi:glycosyltransferase involved in cell wall biosynthesis